MGKKKSIVFITLITILLAALIFFSFVPFPINAVSKFNSFVGSSKLGMELAGGVETVLYPEGVISKEDYQSMQAEYQDKLDDYHSNNQTGPEPVNEANNYTAFKGIFIANKHIDVATGEISNNFRSDFDKAFTIIQKRFEQKLYTNYSIFKQDDYTILVRVPKTNEASSTLFSMMSANGGLHLSGEANTTNDLYINNNDAGLIRSASVVNAGDRYGVRINFTSAGRAKIKELTTGAGQSNNNNGVTQVGGSNSGNKQTKTVYLYLGATQLLQATAEEELDTSSLVFPVSATREAADTVAAVINLSRKQENIFRMKFTTAPAQTFDATMGNYTALILLLTLVAATVVGIVYMFIRYKGLGFVYLLSMVTFLLALILCTTFIPVLVITPTSFIAILFVQLLITIFTKLSFDRIKLEFKKGKTLAKAIRDAFNGTIFLTAEVHGALFVFSVLFYAIATGMMQSVSLLFMLSIALSAAVTLGLNRFYLYLTMPQAKNKIAYCNLRKEVVDLDDED